MPNERESELINYENSPDKYREREEGGGKNRNGYESVKP
jgi:hypothetical protein